MRLRRAWTSAQAATGRAGHAPGLKECRATDSLAHFSVLPDPRMERTKKHQLAEGGLAEEAKSIETGLTERARRDHLVEIIDAHTNLCYPGERFEHQALWPTFESRLGVLREAGVTRAVAYRNESVEGVSYEALVETNQRIAEACRASGGLLLPGATVQPALGDKACALLRSCREELGMRFVGELFDQWLGYQWGTEEYWQVLHEAARLHMVPLIHCSNECLPELAQRCPEGKIMLAHFMRSIEQRVEMMLDHPNLYLVISSSDIARAGELTWAIRTLGAERVAFGSDLGATDPVIAAACVQRAQISEQEKQQAFAGTFHEIWEWTEG